MGADSTQAVTGGSQAPSTPAAPNSSVPDARFAKADAKARAERDAGATGGQAPTGRSAATAQTSTSRAAVGLRQQHDKRSHGEASRGRVTVSMVQKEIATELATTTPSQDMDAQTVADRVAGAARAVRERIGSRALDSAAQRVLDAAERFPTLVKDLRKRRDAIRPDDPSIPEWLRGQLRGGTLDADNLALMKAMGFDANKTAGMSEPERRVLQRNALVSALLQRHKIRISEGSNLLPVVTVNGAPFRLTQEHYEVWRQVADGELSLFAVRLLPLDGRDGELQLLKQASSLLRLERTKSQVAELMRGSRPDDGAALRLLKTSRANANLPGEAQQLWEQAGAPHFDQAYVDAKLQEVANPRKEDWRSFSPLERLIPKDSPLGRAMAGETPLERVGPWLRRVADEAPPEVVDMALTAVKREFNLSSDPRGADLVAGLIKGVEVVAEGTGVDRSPEFVHWLTRSSLAKAVEETGGNPNSLLLQALFKTIDSSDALKPYLEDFRGAVREGVTNAAQKAYRADRASRYREFADRGDESARRASLEPYFARFKSMEGIVSARSFRTDTERHNFIGQMMGLTPVNTAAAQAQDQRQEWYPDKTFEGLQVRWVADKIDGKGGKNAQVRAIPSVYASKDEGDVRRITLFEVVSANGEKTLIDSSAAAPHIMMVGLKDILAGRRHIESDELFEGPWEYKDFKDFLRENQLDRDGMLYRLERRGGSGQLAVVGSAAAQWTGVRKGFYWLDIGMSIAGLAASLALLPWSGGASGTTAGLTGTRLAVMLGFMAYGAVSSGRELYTMHQHSASLSLSNPQARAHWIGGVGGTLVGAATVRTSLKFAAALKAGNLSKAASLARTVDVLGGTDFFIGAAGMTEQTYQLAASASDMNSDQFWKAFGFYALGAAQMGIGLAGPRIVDGYRRLTAGRNGPDTPNPKGLPDDLAMAEVMRETFLGVPRKLTVNKRYEEFYQKLPRDEQKKLPKPGKDVDPDQLTRTLAQLTLNKRYEEFYSKLPDDEQKLLPEPGKHVDAGQFTLARAEQTLNERYKKFHGKLPLDEQEKLPKPGTDIDADQLTRALAQLPGGLEKVILDIHAHPMGYIQRLDVTLESSEGKIKAGDSYNADTRDGYYTVTPNEVHLVANEDRSSARWRPDDPGNIEGLAADGSCHQIPIDAVLPPTAGAAARHLRELLRAGAQRFDPRAVGQARAGSGQAGGLRPLVKDGQLSQDGLNDRLNLAYGGDTKLLGFTDQSGRHWALIPQLCGGGYPHYSNFDPSELSMRGREWLDEIAQKEWLELYNKEATRNIAEKIDVGIIGLDFSDQGRRTPVDRLDELALQFPGVAWSVGEVTARKEMVSTQLGDYGWTLWSPRFRAFLDRIAKSGHMLLLHNDGGEPGIDPRTGRPAAAKTQYEHFEEMVEALGRKDLRKVNVVIAHTFFGRFVRPSDAPLRRERMRIVKWDFKNNEEGFSVVKTIEAPEHIIRMYEVAEQVPNARFDISWNDISQAYAHPNLRKHLVEFILDYPDRVLFGSDTVKPVNAGHYNQGLYTVLPVLAELARKEGGPEALWKVLRGNYETLRENAQTRVARDTRRLLEKRGRGQEADAMDERLKALKAVRETMGEDAEERQFNAWVKQVRALPSLDQVDGGSGVFETLYNLLPQSAGHPEHSTGRTGRGTPGGDAHADGSEEQKWARFFSGLGLGTSAAVVAGLANTPFSGETANNLAFLFRGLLTASKAGSSRWLRLQFEDIFEQGRVSPEKLDQFVGRILRARKDLGFSDQQIAHFLAATKQFQANYQYLEQRNLEPREPHFLKLMAKAGEYQITVDRILGGQASSITPLDPRRTAGAIFRIAQLATLVVNDAAFVHWLGQNGFDTSTPQAKLHSTVRVLFAAGNAVSTGSTAVSLWAGLTGVNWDSATGMRLTNLGAQALITTGGALWTAQDGWQAVTAFGAGQADAAVTAAIKACLDAAFTYYVGKSTGHAGKVELGWRQEGPSDLEKTAFLVGTYLFLRMVVELASEEERRDDKRSQAAPQGR